MSIFCPCRNGVAAGPPFECPACGAQGATASAFEKNALARIIAAHCSVGPITVPARYFHTCDAEGFPILCASCGACREHCVRRMSCRAVLPEGMRYGARHVHVMPLRRARHRSFLASGCRGRYDAIARPDGLGTVSFGMPVIYEMIRYRQRWIVSPTQQWWGRVLLKGPAEFGLRFAERQFTITRNGQEVFRVEQVEHQGQRRAIELAWHADAIQVVPCEATTCFYEE